MGQSVTVNEIISTANSEEITSPEGFSEDDLKWFEEVSKKYDDASTASDFDLETALLEKSYREWFKEETKAYFSPVDYDNPEFQAYLKSFE